MALGKIRTLVVDDDAGARSALTSLLEAEGYQVDTAPDGQAALDRLVELPPDVIVTDLDMPVMNGMQLLADLRDLAVYQALLEQRNVRGVVVDCAECQEPHYHDWALLRASLEQLLSDGRMRPHEPAYDPDPDHYVTWEYARGYADGIHDALAEGADEPDEGKNEPA